jgi:MOSC domain-containing protein YiiM
MSLNGRLMSIQISTVGGVPKLPLAHADVETSGIVGDRQRNTARHGGPLRAVSLYALERITALQAEGHPISPGSTGENLTLSGIDWSLLQPGALLQVGDWVELELLSYVTPCATISASFRDGDFQRIAQPRFPGWSRLYARVLSPGRISVGDAVTVTLPA